MAPFRLRIHGLVIHGPKLRKKRKPTINDTQLNIFSVIMQSHPCGKSFFVVGVLMHHFSRGDDNGQCVRGQKIVRKFSWRGIS